MNNLGRFFIVLLVMALALPAAADTPKSKEEALAMIEQLRNGGKGTNAEPREMPESVLLERRDFEGALKAIGELKELGTRLDIEDTEIDSQELAQALAANQEAMRIVSANGFESPEMFQRKLYSIVLAVAAVENEKNQPEMEEAKKKAAAAFETMQGSMTPEQIEMFKDQLGLAESHMQQFFNQPEQNKKLAREFGPRIQKAFEGKHE